jgi:hypothetical protein
MDPIKHFYYLVDLADSPGAATPIVKMRQAAW